jgi:L-asparaginase/Glu-tRNA(Gln) amidotransferase subunit D
MPQTAQVLGPANLGKTIVLTGAMIPYEIANSDAMFNLGFAAGVAQTLPPGVRRHERQDLRLGQRAEKQSRRRVPAAVTHPGQVCHWYMSRVRLADLTQRF